MYVNCVNVFFVIHTQVIRLMYMCLWNDRCTCVCRSFGAEKSVSPFTEFIHGTMAIQYSHTQLVLHIRILLTTWSYPQGVRYKPG